LCFKSGNHLKVLLFGAPRENRTPTSFENGF
jgi:hypothetical protein